MNNINPNRKGILPTPRLNKSPAGPYGTNYSSMTAHNTGRIIYNRPYFSDQLILGRVSQYLQNSGRNIVDYDHMVDELQREHREYRRKKRSAFKHHLKKAMEVIAFENDLAQDDEIIEDDDEEDNIEIRGEKSPAYAFEGDGDVNSALEDSYLQQNAKRRKVSESAAQELISIVTSDEDNDETPVKQSEGKNNELPLPKKEMAPKSITDEIPPTPASNAEAVDTQKSKTKKRRPELDSLGNKRFKSCLEPARPTVTFKDIGGNEKVLQEVTQLLVHMRHPEVYRVLGVSPPRGFLLHGPPGSGKTLLAHAISGELKVPLLKVAAPELVGGLSGQSEERIRELFEQAVALAPCILFIDEVDAITPNRETAHREMERRIVAQLLSSMDELANNENGDQVLVIGATNRPDSLDPALRRAGRFDREVCLGIPDRGSRASILRTLCQTLRLDPDLELAEVAMMTPGYVGADLKSLVTEAAMAAVNRLFKTLNEINEKSIENGPESKPVDAKQFKEGTDNEATMDIDTPSADVDGDVTIVDKSDEKDGSTADKPKPDKSQEGDGGGGEGSKAEDIQVLDNENEDTSDEVQVLKVQTAPLSLLHSPPLSLEQLQGVFITKADFQVALKAVQPSAKREGFATVPDVKWEDIGSLQDIRQELEMAILAPVKFPEEFACMGVGQATGVLLCGPPGCGKTLLAKAVANEAGINFISVKGPELLNMYVGESERAVRQCFQRARSSQPCVIFFDEIDALCPKRTNMENGASRVVNQLLTEMDGMDARPGVFIMAATNRPDIVDPAVMRPGRLDKVLYVGLPDATDRVDILRALTKGGSRPVLDEDVDLAVVGGDARCDGYSGADLAALVREASMVALKEFMSSKTIGTANLKVCSRHFTAALVKIRPSVSNRDKKRYEDIRLQYAAVPSTI